MKEEDSKNGRPLPPPKSSVYYLDELKLYYPNVEFGINCAIANPAYVKIGTSVVMAHHSSITAVTEYRDIYYQPSIKIGDGTQIGPYNAFAAIDRIQIGDYVLFAPYVFLIDHDHGYMDVSKPIMHQPASSKGPIIIEDGCWLGLGSIVTSGVIIGRNSVIGANSIVNDKIPPYCVAAGNPAKIVKRYDFISKKWVNTATDQENNFFQRRESARSSSGNHSSENLLRD